MRTQLPKLLKQCSRKLGPRLLHNVVLLSAISLSACAVTEIPRPSIPKEVFELAAVNSRPLQVVVDAEVDALRSGPFTAGHQYLLLAIPFGRVALSSPLDHVNARLYEQLALQGIKPLTTQNHDFGPVPLLRVTIKQLSVSAYDGLVTRRVNAAVELLASLTAPSGDILWSEAFEGSESSFQRYGFAPELTEALDKALIQALTPMTRHTASSITKGPQRL